MFWYIVQYYGSDNLLVLQCPYTLGMSLWRVSFFRILNLRNRKSHRESKKVTKPKEAKCVGNSKWIVLPGTDGLRSSTFGSRMYYNPWSTNLFTLLSLYKSKRVMGPGLNKKLTISDAPVRGSSNFWLQNVL